MRNEICKEFLGAFFAVTYVPNRICAVRPPRHVRRPIEGTKNRGSTATIMNDGTRRAMPKLQPEPRCQQACSLAVMPGAAGLLTETPPKSFAEPVSDPSL